MEGEEEGDERKGRSENTNFMELGTRPSSLPEALKAMSAFVMVSSSEISFFFFIKLNNEKQDFIITIKSYLLPKVELLDSYDAKSPNHSRVEENSGQRGDRLGFEVQLCHLVVFNLD